VAVATAVLCFTAPSVPGVATPTFVTYILAIVCLVGLAVQPVGFVGAFRVRPPHLAPPPPAPLTCRRRPRRSGSTAR
jgi:hypothetical protein